MVGRYKDYKEEAAERIVPGFEVSHLIHRALLDNADRRLPSQLSFVDELRAGNHLALDTAL